MSHLGLLQKFFFFFFKVFILLVMVSRGKSIIFAISTNEGNFDNLVISKIF